MCKRGLFGLALLLSAGPARAQTTAPAARPSVRPVLVQTPPVIDGRLDDQAWRVAAHIANFVQRRPLDGAPSTEKTDVYMAYDADQMYFGVVAHYSDPDLIRANHVDRDQIWNDDRISIIFDPFQDQQRAYRFAVNGYGVQGDALISGGSSATTGAGDTSWNVLFASAGAPSGDGWTVEIAIPFKSLRYPARGTGEPHRWGLQIERDIMSKNENVVWAPISRDVMSELGQMGTLDGMTNLSMNHNLEILPTVTGVHTEALNATGGFQSDGINEAGLNVKYGLTSNLTFDMTYNPDFSQIESDRQQIEVNQRFPVLYPELRPFFLEGQEIFRVPGPVTFIHTRTIVDPQFGAKLSGKVGKTTVALLVANDEAPGKAVGRTDPAYGRKANFVIGRARYDLFRESTTSVIFTDREFMNQHSRAFGGDGDFAIGSTHRFFARVIATDQRDAAGVRRTGYFYDFNFRKAGRNLGYSLISNAISPNLRTDVGFVRRTDQRQSLANLSYRWWPGNAVVSWTPRLSHSRNYQFNGVLQEELNGASVNIVFARNVTVDAGLNRDMERYRDLDFWKTRYSVAATINSSRRVTTAISLTRGDQIRFVVNPFLGVATAWSADVTVKPVTRFQSEFSLSTTKFIEPRTGHQEFDIKIARLQTTYQFTERLLIRNITEHNTFDQTAGLNVLMTYRVNAGTVFYAGYDDRYKEGGRIDPLLFTQPGYQRTNRAVFAKLQYLFRHQG